MGEVVQMSPLAWWVCGCGCMSFHMRSDGRAECCNCETVQAAPELGKWVSPRKFDGDASEADPNAFRTVSGDFGHRRISKRIADGEFDYVVAIKHDGALSTHGETLETDEQKAWLGRRLEVARKLLCAESVTMDSD